MFDDDPFWDSDFSAAVFDYAKDSNWIYKVEIDAGTSSLFDAIRVDIECRHGIQYSHIVSKLLISAAGAPVKAIVGTMLAGFYHQCLHSHPHDVPDIKDGYFDSVATVADLKRLCPGLGSRLPEGYHCPQVGCENEPRPRDGPLNVLVLIIHLNDTHHWSREKIADYLEILDVDLNLITKEQADAAAEAEATAAAIRSANVVPDWLLGAG